MMATNRRLAPQGPDHYVTPAWGTRALTQLEKFRGDILEPCCGTGEMAEVLRSDTGCRVVASDLYDRGYGRVADFLRRRAPVDNVVTNPPYAIAEDVLERALSVASRKVCLLLRTAFLEGVERYHKFYDQRPPSRLLVFSRRLSMYPSSSPRTGGGTQSYSWFVWDLQNRSGETRIVWISPDSRDAR